MDRGIFFMNNCLLDQPSGLIKENKISIIKKRFNEIWGSPARILLFVNLVFIVIIYILGFFPRVFDKKVNTTDIAYYNEQKVAFFGRVCEEAEVDISSRRLTICAAGRVLIKTSLYPEYNYGDYLKVSGKLQTPPVMDLFNYEEYLARYDIYSVMYFAQLEPVARVANLNYSQTTYLALLKLKQSLKRNIDLNLPEPEAGLANALIFGYRRTVSREDLDMFARVGLSHMIAISGSHITILSALALNFLLALGFYRRQSLKIVLIFLFLYPLITGLSASAVRSSIMGALAFLAIYHERLSSLFRALVFSAALMLAFNPHLLRVDIGFQLSFLALLGIIYIYPIGEFWTNNFLEKMRFSRRTKKKLKMIFDTVNLTMVSQVVIMPIALINFQQLSLVAPLANVLVLWTFPWLLMALICALVLSVLISFLGIIFFLPAYLLLKYIFIVSECLAAMPLAAVEVTGFNWYWGVAYYLILWILVGFLRRRKLKNI